MFPRPGEQLGTWPPGRGFLKWENQGMATLLDLYHLMNSDGDLWKKVEAAALKAATAIKYEDPLTANHAARLEWANGIFADPKAWTVTNKVKVLENATIAAAGHKATDNDVEFVVASLAPVAA